MRTHVALAALGLVCASCSPSFEQEFLASQQEVSSLQAEVRSLSEDTTSLRLEATAAAEAAATEMAGLTEALDTARSTAREMQKYKTAYSATVCEHPIEFGDVKFSSVMDTSTVLASWVARQDWAEGTSRTFRDKIWSNSLSQLHGISYKDTDGDTYVTYFMVFADLGFEESIFWLDGQCWLVPPKSATP